MTKAIALAARIANVRTQIKIIGDLVLRKSDHQRAGLPFPKSAPLDGETSFTFPFQESFYSEMRSLQIAQRWKCMARRCCGILVPGLGRTVMLSKLIPKTRCTEGLISARVDAPAISIGPDILIWPLVLS